MGGPLRELLKSLFMALAGLGLVATGVGFAVYNARFIDEADRADGVVESVLRKRGSRGMPLYYPVVRFRPAERAESVEFTARPGLWPSPYHEGDRVRVAFRRADPEDAKIVSFSMLWLLPLLTALVGGGCVFAGWHTYRHGWT